MPDFQTVLNAIGSVGFPIAITIYIVVKLNCTIERLTETIKDVSTQNKLILQALDRRRFDEN